MSKLDWEEIDSSEEVKQAALGALPRSLTDEQREQAEKAVEEAFTAASEQDENRLVSATLRLARELPAATHPSPSESQRMKNPWLACEGHCLRHLDDGNAPFYATCYWACVVRNL